jgi:hypothetical protein
VHHFIFFNAGAVPEFCCKFFQMFRYLLLGLLAFFLYKLIFGLIIPVYRTTRKVRKKFREFEQQMNQTMSPKQEEQPAPVAKNRNTSKDYIEFEDIASRD